MNLDDRIERGERITPQEAVALLGREDVHALGRAANRLRERKNGSNAYYVKNLHLNYTNLCVHACSFCGFARPLNAEEGAWEMKIQDVLEYANRHHVDRLTEIHIVGGLNPHYPFDFYTGMLRTLKTKYPAVHLKAFTATEIDFISKIGKRSHADTLSELRQAGLDSLPGGGAEIFSQRVWDEMCDRKTPPKTWLSIHREAHRQGLHSTATMLYGHIETLEERIEHMRLLRELQDETGGFTAFIPITFQPEDNALAHLGRTSSLDDLRTHAVARIFLDNFDHIKAYWVTLGAQLAQVMLSFGADDIDGMIVREKIMHMAGARTPGGLEEEQLVETIREAGRVPVQRDSVYTDLKKWD